MTRLMRRLARLTPHEAWVRTSQLAHTAGETFSVAAGRARWDRRQLRSKLRAGEPSLEAVRRALASHEWARADAALRSHFLERSGQFVIAPGDRPRLAGLIRERFPESADLAVARATSLLEGRYDLLGYKGLTFPAPSGEVDWHFDPVHGRRPPIAFWRRVRYLDAESGDHKVIWELNRHQHWLALGRAAWLTGDSRYAARFARELSSWLRANPPLVGINWASMLELAFRAISWVWAVHLFAGFETGGESSFVDLLLALDRQLDHIERHLSTYFSPNTHLLGEGLALYVAGRSLPELDSSPRWESAGRAILLREARAQVHPDGGHAELSTHYHRYTLDFYLLALLVARRTDDPAAAAFEDVATRLAVFCRSMADNRGRLPAIGDDDGGTLFPICRRAPFDVADSLGLAAAALSRPELAVGELPEEAMWMLGADHGLATAREDGNSPPPASRLFPDTGYAVIRREGTHAVLDVGSHGFLNGGHAHADALSLVLSMNERQLLIDPGTSTYTMDPAVRDRFRSTPMHNTLMLDGRGQSQPDGPFHWASAAQACVDFWRAGAGFALIEASHDGYLPVRHRRTVLHTSGDLVLVADHVLGTGRHQADVHWHLGPDWRLTRAGGTHAGLADSTGVVAALASTASQWRDFYGDSEGLGWCAPVYGQLEPALTLRFSAAAVAPFSVITAVACGEAAAGLCVHELRVTGDDAGAWHHAAAALRWDGGTALVLFATPRGPDVPSNRRPVQTIETPDGLLATDARACVLHFSTTEFPTVLTAIDCSVVEWTGPDPFTLSPHPGEQDLHLGVSAHDRLSHLTPARPGG